MLRLGNKFLGKIEKYIPTDSSITDSPPTITLEAITRENSTNDFYKGGIVTIIKGTSIGQSKNIVSYNATTGKIVLDSIFTDFARDTSTNVPSTDTFYNITPTSSSSNSTMVSENKTETALTKITDSVNGIIYKIEMTCIEIPYAVNIMNDTFKITSTQTNVTTITLNSNDSNYYSSGSDAYIFVVLDGTGKGTKVRITGFTSGSSGSPNSITVESAISVASGSKYVVINQNDTSTDVFLNVGLAVSSSNGHTGSHEYQNGSTSVYYNTNLHHHHNDKINSKSNSPVQPYFVLKSSEYNGDSNIYDKIYLGQVRTSQDEILTTSPSSYNSNFPLLFSTNDNTSLVSDKYLYLYRRNATSNNMSSHSQIVGGKFLIKLYITKTFS